MAGLALTTSAFPSTNAAIQDVTKLTGVQQSLSHDTDGRLLPRDSRNPSSEQRFRALTPGRHRRCHRAE